MFKDTLGRNSVFRLFSVHRELLLLLLCLRTQIIRFPNLIEFLTTHYPHRNASESFERTFYVSAVGYYWNPHLSRSVRYTDLLQPESESLVDPHLLRIVSNLVDSAFWSLAAECAARLDPRASQFLLHL